MYHYAEFNNLTAAHVAARLKQADLANGIADFVKETYFNEKLKKITK